MRQFYPPVDPIMNPEGNSPPLLVRRECRQTVFAAVHEPYKFNAPAITEVGKIAASDDAYLAGREEKDRAGANARLDVSRIVGDPQNATLRYRARPLSHSPISVKF
jgi:hypothetical protein